MKRWLLIPLVFLALPLQAAVVGEEITYSADGTELKGYVAYDDAIKGKRPGVLVVHEWWGHNEYARKRAQMLAEEGYVGFALDMYGGGKTAGHPDQAGEFSAAVKQNMPMAEKRFRAALDVLKKHPQVNRRDIAAIGYCFGGGIVLEMARRGVPLDAVASFHGSLTTDNPAEPGEVQADIFVANGADDPFVKDEQVRAFKEEMEQADAEYRFVSYPGAKHSFTNPDATRLGEKFGLPLEYNEQADKQSWAAMLRMFDTVFSR